MEKLKNIEFLRVLLISIIIILHITAYGSWSLLKNFSGIAELKIFHDIFIQGNNTVDGFFIIAGFLLIYTFKNISIKEFIKKKYIRFSPTIIFSVIVCFIASLFHAIKFRFWDDLLVILLLNNFGYCFAHGTTPALWFTSALFSGLLLYFSLIKIKNKNLKILLFIIFPCAAYILLEILQHGSFASPHKNYYIFNIGFLRALGGTGLGVLTGFLYNLFKNKILPFIYKILINLAEISLICFILWWLICPHEPLNCIIFVIAFAMLICLFSLKQGIISKLTDKELWVKLGKYQYSFYIIHSVIGKILLNVCWKNNIDFVKNHPYSTISIVILAILIGGILTYHLVEKPCTNFLKRKFG